MRVAHVLTAFLPASETFIYTQLRAQADLDQAVFAKRRMNKASFPFAPVDVDPVGRYASALVHVWRDPAGRSDLYSRRLCRRIAGFRPDLIHAHFGWAAVDAVFAAQAQEIPLVVAFHGADVYAPQSSVRGMPDSYRHVFETGRLFTCVGPEAASALEALGCPPDRIHVVPVGLDLAQLPFAPSTPTRPLILLQVARLTPKKGVDTTIDGFARARDRLGDSRLWIVGDGPERKRLQQLSVRLGVSQVTRFWGAQTHERVVELMAQAHVGVQPSRVAPNGDREGTPTVILEMQARGIPVAATRHADIPFIVPHPEELVPEGDPEGLAEELVRLVSLTPTERSDRLATARSSIEQRHDARQIALMLRELYRTALRSAVEASR